MAAGNVNGDGLSEWLIAAPMAADAGVESGTVYAHSIVRDVRTCCESTPNSLGCLPTVLWSGMPSVANAQPFTIGATQVINQKSGFLFYGFAPQLVLGLGSSRGVVAPTRRTPNQLSGGNAQPGDCSGAFD